MRVAELVAPRRFELADREPAAPGPGEVQVKVGAVGICGSDVHYFSEGTIGDTPCVYPMVMGHEPAGVVVRTGAGVSGWQPGDRAALEPAVYCYHCEYCLSGRHNVCANLRFLSMPRDPGFLRDYVNLPAQNLLALPSGLSLQEATLFEPLAVVLHSMSFAQPRPGERFVVFGAGPIGLLTILALRLSGAGRIWAVEPVEARRQLALGAGADAALDPTQVDAAGEIERETSGRGADGVIDCAARGDSMDRAIACVRNAGRFVVTGIPTAARVSLDFHTLRRKEVAVYNVRRSNRDSETALELLRDHRLRFAALLTHEMPLESVQGAFEMVERYQDGVGKAILKL